MHATTYYESPILRVMEVNCRPEHSGCSAEECAGGNHIVFPHAGVFVRHVHGDRVVADASQVLFFNKGETHRVSHPVEGGDDCFVLAFRADLLTQAIGAHDPSVEERPQLIFPRTHNRVTETTLLRERALRHRLVAGDAADLEVEEMAFDILADVARAGVKRLPAKGRRERASAQRLRRERVEAVKVLLAAAPDANPSLMEIGRRVHCSPYHLARQFAEYEGMPIHQHLLRLRLALALDRMLAGERDILDLALDLGFSSHSHFTASFKRAFGVSPSELRASVTHLSIAQMRKNLTARHLVA